MRHLGMCAHKVVREAKASDKLVVSGGHSVTESPMNQHWHLLTCPRKWGLATFVLACLPLCFSEYADPAQYLVFNYIYVCVCVYIYIATYHVTKLISQTSANA